MHLPSRRLLLDSFRRGDPSALREVYDLYSADLARALAANPRLRASTLDLADVLQEVFLRAFQERARQEYDGVGSYLAYLRGIAHHVQTDALRRTYTAQAFQQQQASHDAPLAPRPDELAEEAEAARLVDEWRAALNEDERAVYEQRFVHNRSQEDAAGALKMTRIQLRRVERTLRQLLLNHLKNSGYLEGLVLRGWRLFRPGRRIPTRQAGR